MKHAEATAGHVLGSNVTFTTTTPVPGHLLDVCCYQLSTLFLEI